MYTARRLFPYMPTTPYPYLTRTSNITTRESRVQKGESDQKAGALGNKDHPPVQRQQTSGRRGSGRLYWPSVVQAPGQREPKQTQVASILVS